MIQKGFTRACRLGSDRSERERTWRARVPARPPGAVFILIYLLLSTPRVTWGVAEWHGQPGQYIAIENGLAPNRRLAIAAHEDQTGRFGLFLQDRETQRPIAEVAIVLEPLDTAPEAFHAEWAPDSHHVAIWHRIDT